MCGIIGYIGSKDVVPVLIDGLRRLEYRGYDSAGIAVVTNGDVGLRRSAGKLSQLEAVLDASPIAGEYGVGHTRWATHGRPTDENAHPHRDCTGRVIVVHNGIIENYLELKQELQRDGHQFRTQTDTEVVAHLVEHQLKTGGTSGEGVEHAVRRALARMRGLFALVIISADDPDKIVAVRNGPPIVIGLGEDDKDYFVASDVTAILSHTRDIVFLGDEEMAVITRSGVAFTDFYGTTVSPVQQRVLWDPVAVEKAGYPHFMLKEIFEQPTAARQTIGGHVTPGSGEVCLKELQLTDGQLADIERVVILACGTSWHAGLVGKFMIEKLARVSVDVDYGSEYRYRHPIANTRTLAVVITQSGETADTLAALREAKHEGTPSIAICNVTGSMATREADGTLYTHAGPEIGVASTKAFTSQLVALYLLALKLARARGVMSAEHAVPHVTALLQLPQLLEQTLQLAPQIETIAQSIVCRTDALFLGRGVNYPIALEGALKLKEISYVHAEGYPAGEMKHGPIALIDERMPVVVVAPEGCLFEKMIGNIQEAKARGGAIVALTSGAASTRAQLESILDPAHDFLVSVPVTSELLTPILMAVPLQLLAYHVAVCRGCDVDQPRNLAKSVTVE
ncbi:MAG TPA: glutamine--fructose-6-phosphate transaminase (isomerizing) [Vicinamibacterales bacterium]|nr:glutamine--fructose-6-phosphate transaminase (isomerizing) [Vicinamibacterales bacterium]